MPASVTGTRQSCTCEACQSACQHKPGWFLPGEAEEAAYLLDMSLDKFFLCHLVVEKVEGADGKEVLVLSPAVEGGDTGHESDGPVSGTCVFFEGGLCTIHDAKPHECRMALHGEPSDAHSEVVEAWVDEQAQIMELLELGE